MTLALGNQPYQKRLDAQADMDITFQQFRWNFHAATLLPIYVLQLTRDSLQKQSEAMVSAKDVETYRKDVKSHGRQISVEEREKLIRPYLPPKPERPPSKAEGRRQNGVKPKKKRRQKPIRSFLKNKLHVLVYFAIHLIFGIYIRLRQTYHAVVDRVLALLYYHHRTPELIQRDVKNLSRLPEHLSVILTLKGEEDGGLEALMDDVAELSAWCASASIPLLSVYEKSGMCPRPQTPQSHI
jgi:dehydrodolichyl diphosphate syntase complex subunit NUS1